eukprot:621137_1
MSDTQEEVLKSADQNEKIFDVMGTMPEEILSEVVLAETTKSMGSVKVSDTKPSEDPIHENEEEQNPEEGAGITLPPVPEEAGDTPVADIADDSQKKRFDPRRGENWRAGRHSLGREET